MERLEAALERIARLARPAPAAPEGAATAIPGEIRDRLDQIIGRLRSALDAPS